MAEQSFFWDGTTVGDAVLSPYNSDEFVAVLKAMTGAGGAPFQSGVFRDELNELSSSVGANAFGVNTGRAQVHGTVYINTVNFVISIPSANATSRRDRITLRKDWATQTIRINRIAGTEGVGPGAYINTEGVLWDMPLFTIDVNTAGVVTVVTDDRVYLPYITDLVSGTLPSVTSIPNLVLSDYTKNLITVLNNLTSTPILALSDYTKNLITVLNNLTSVPNLALSTATLNLITLLNNLTNAPALNYNGLTGLVPPMCSLWFTGTYATVPSVDSDDVFDFDVPNGQVRVDTTNGAMFNQASFPSRITCTLTGLYEVSSTVGMQPHASVNTTLILRIRRNGSVNIASAQQQINNNATMGAGFIQCVLAPTVINLNAGDYIELVSDHLGVTSPAWAVSRENNFTLKYVGARTANCVGSII
jgi:hypothetical protein